MLFFGIGHTFPNAGKNLLRCNKVKVGEGRVEHGAWQVGRLHKEAVKLHSCIRYNNTQNVCKRTNVALGEPKERKRPDARGVSTWALSRTRDAIRND